MVVGDDGCGLPAPPPDDRGIGGIRERAMLVGDTVEVDSTPGRGTRVVLSTPCTNDDDAAEDEARHRRRHALVRRGLQSLFDPQPDFEVVGHAQDGAEAVRCGLETGADLAVLDIAMPRMTGLAAAREIAQRRPQTRVLMLSMHDNEQYFFEALKAGASGYVLKSTADRDLVDACRSAMRGEPVFFSGAVTGEDPRKDLLTPRELEVVKLIAEAYTNEQISEQLVISRKTVERHRANILEKLGMRDRVELTRYAIRRGLIEP